MMDTEQLLSVLRRSVKGSVAGSDAVAVAYSGGVDSALIEALAREATRTVCYTCAAPGSHDMTRAPAWAAESAIELRMLRLDRVRLERLVVEACDVLHTDEPLRVAYTVPVICVLDESDEEVVLTGSAADELFGGYAKYLEDADPETRMEADLARAFEDARLLGAHAKSIGKRLESPFSSPEVVSFAKGLPTDRKLGHGNRKIILREAARSLGVLSHDSPKKAAQYSSGVMKEMKLMAKARGLELREWTAELAAKGRRIP